jgi:SAM-dependent MidA family methyltransferase
MSLKIKNKTRVAQQIRMSTLPAEMEERFKVMALGNNYVHALRGFSMMDQCTRL